MRERNRKQDCQFASLEGLKNGLGFKRSSPFSDGDQFPRKHFLSLRQEYLMQRDQKLILALSFEQLDGCVVHINDLHH